MNNFKLLFKCSIGLMLIWKLQSCQFKVIDSEALFNQYFEVYPISEAVIDSTFDSPFFSFYKKGSYIGALHFIDSTSYQDNLELRLYEGIAALKSNKLDRAAMSFLTYKNAKGRLPNQANWYLALTFLKMKDFDAAKALLRGLSKNDNEPQLKQQAKALLEAF